MREAAAVDCYDDGPVEGGGWRVEGGGWRVEGRSRVVYLVKLRGSAKVLKILQVLCLIFYHFLLYIF